MRLVVIFTSYNKDYKLILTSLLKLFSLSYCLIYNIILLSFLCYLLQLLKTTTARVLYEVAYLSFIVKYPYVKFNLVSVFIYNICKKHFSYLIALSSFKVTYFLRYVISHLKRKLCFLLNL